MARTTLEMFIKIVGANKVAKALDNVSDELKDLQRQTDKSKKSNAQFAAGMSSLKKTAIAGGALFAAKSLADFSLAAIQAASSAQEAAGAFGTTFGGAAEKLNKQLAENANLFGLTTSEAQQLISVFGSVAQGIGFTQQESADLSSELFNLAGDIASFNNITAGAAPVLQAFRSALVGEREALKTYGIAITEAEVQTKAFAQTGKVSADELTRQEKALATTALIFERSAVQQGNAAREAAGFAAQQLIARSATQELREELGEKLLPAAGEILKTFNEIRTDATPALIDTFEDLNLQVLGLVEGFDRLRGLFRPDDYDEINKQLKEQFGLFPDGIFGLKGLGRERLREIELEKEQIQRTQELSLQLTNYKFNLDEITKSFVLNRQGVAINRVAYQKFGEEIDKKFNPIFGEQNSLILTNIQLETDRKKLLDLISSGNDDVALATRNRNQAAKELQELQIQENVRDAEAAIRKAELQTKIALLTEAQANGKDVTLDLALAEAELAEAEFELANESDRLKLARDALTIAENNLETALKNQEAARVAARDALIGETEATKEDTKERNKNADAIQKQIDLIRLFKSIETDPFRFKPPTPEPEPDPEPSPEPSPSPVPTVSDNSNMIDSGLQKAGAGGDTNLNIVLELEGETLQSFNTRLQKQGKTFLVS